MNNTEEKVVAGNAAILTPHCLCCRLSHINVLCTVHRRTTIYMYVQCIIVTTMFVAYVYLTNMEEEKSTTSMYRYTYTYNTYLTDHNVSVSLVRSWLTAPHPRLILFHRTVYWSQQDSLSGVQRCLHGVGNRGVEQDTERERERER